MPIHDWTRVDAGIFHHFHVSWIDEIAGALNSGLLPRDFYALVEQISGNISPDVLTLAHPVKSSYGGDSLTFDGGIAVAARPPKVAISRANRSGPLCTEGEGDRHPAS